MLLHKNWPNFLPLIEGRFPGNILELNGDSGLRLGLNPQLRYPQSYPSEAWWSVRHGNLAWKICVCHWNMISGFPEIWFERHRSTGVTTRCPMIPSKILLYWRKYANTKRDKYFYMKIGRSPARKVRKSFLNALRRVSEWLWQQNIFKLSGLI